MVIHRKFAAAMLESEQIQPLNIDDEPGWLSDGVSSEDGEDGMDSPYINRETCNEQFQFLRQRYSMDESAAQLAATSKIRCRATAGPAFGKYVHSAVARRCLQKKGIDTNAVHIPGADIDLSDTASLAD